MARSAAKTKRYRDGFDRDGFDITQEKVVGHVSYDGNGQDSPMEAAFRIIAGHSEDGGTFRFPLNDEGHYCVVNVDFEGLPQPAEAEAEAAY